MFFTRSFVGFLGRFQFQQIYEFPHKNSQEVKDILRIVFVLVLSFTKIVSKHETIFEFQFEYINFLWKPERMFWNIHFSEPELGWKCSFLSYSLFVKVIFYDKMWRIFALDFMNVFRSFSQFINKINNWNSRNFSSTVKWNWKTFVHANKKIAIFLSIERILWSSRVILVSFYVKWLSEILEVQKLAFWHV